MKRLLSAILFASLVLAQGVSAQGVYVSKTIADAMQSGKVYLEILSQMGMIKMAIHGNVAMSRMRAMGRDMVSLGTDKANFLLDEKKKQWSALPNNDGTPQFTTIRFKGQGTCKVNGESGWYYDEYTTQPGQSVTFYYNSDKVAGVELGGEMSALGAMALHSCSATIPADMYFCVGSDWTSAGAANPAPPQCATPWKDNGTAVELACGNAYDKFVVTDKQNISKPVYAASMSRSDAPSVARTDMNITEEGILKALEQVIDDTKDMTAQQFSEYMFNFYEETSMAMLCRNVTGEMAEMAIARAHVYPHPVALCNVAEIYLMRGEMDKAEEYLHEAEEMDKDNLIVQTALFDCYFEKSEFGKAHKVIPRLIELYPEDGSGYLNLARLQIVEGNYMEAADNLFKSMSCGHFEEFSAELIMSYLAAIDEAIIAAQEDDADPKEVVDRIFSKQNLDLIRKGISLGFNITPSPSKKTFNWDFSAGAIEQIHKSLEKRSETLFKWSDMAHKKAENAIKDGDTEKRNALYFAMGQKYLGENIQQIMDAATGLKAVQKKMPGTKREVMEVMTDGWSNTYAMLTQQLGTLDNVSGYYLPDILSYWGVFLLNRYHMYMYDYYHGDWSHAEDLDKDGIEETLKGCYPAAYKARFDKELSTNARNHKVGQQIDEKYDQMGAKDWKEALEIELRKLQEVYAIDKECAIANTTHWQQHYNAVVRPEMEAWWDDISKYSQFFMEKNMQEFYQQQALAQLYSRWADIYSSTDGGHLDDLQKMMDEIKKQIGKIKEADRQEKHEELMQLVQDMVDSRQFDYDQKARVHDFYLEVPTPSGVLKFGMMDGKIGYQMYNRHTGKQEGILGGEYVSQRIYKPLSKESEASSYLKDKVKNYVKGKVQGLAEVFLGKTALAAAKAAIDAKNGELVKWNRESYNAGVIDSQGNVTNKKTIKREEVNFGGVVKGVTEVHQVHNVQRTKHKLEIPAGVFTFHMGKYQKTR